MREEPLAIVLAGGGARGAYQAGVLRYIFGTLAAQVGQRLAPDLICGTSVGAINGAWLGGLLGRGDGPEELTMGWQTMRLDRIYHFHALDLVRSPLQLLGAQLGEHRSLVDPTPSYRWIRQQLPFGDLHAALDSGRLGGLVVAATTLHTGRCTLFTDHPTLPQGVIPHHGEVCVIPTRIRARHCLASAAMPFVFPPVTVREEAYVDGGLRQNTPLSPALSLGAERILVVGTERKLADQVSDAASRDHEDLALTHLVGKALNTMMLDPVERDLRHVALVNKILAWGGQAGGEGWLDRVNALAEPSRHQPFRPVETLLIQPSEDLGQIAATTWRDTTIKASAATRLLLEAVAVTDDPHDADLLSYLFFDCVYTERLIDLGFRDAPARREDLAAFLGLGDQDRRTPGGS